MAWQPKQLIGPPALQPRTASGRPPKLDAAARQALIEKLEAGALAAGFPTEQWTQACIKQVIEREFGVNYHRDYISRLRLIYNIKTPR